MSNVKKAVIPAAGLGTGFLPATKAMAKEMLPIVDKPTIQFIVEEAIESGIEEILIVTGRSKRSIEDHFDANFELEQNLRSKGKHSLLKIVEETTKVKLHFVRQSYPNGLGDAVLHARSFIGNEPFVVLLGDDLMESQPPLTKQLMDHYDRTGSSILAAIKVPHKETSKYGIIDSGTEIEDGLYEVRHFVEKPESATAPSDLAIIGRYLLTPEIFELLERQKPGAEDEVQLTDAIETLNKTQKVLAHEFKGKRFDVGEKFGYLSTSIEQGLNHPEVKDELKHYLISLSKELRKKGSAAKSESRVDGVFQIEEKP